METGFTET